MSPSSHPAIPLHAPDAFDAQMAERGWYVCDARLAPALLDRLAPELERAYAHCQALQEARGLEPAAGAVHHVLGLGESFLELLADGVPLEALRRYMGAEVILN